MKEKKISKTLSEAEEIIRLTKHQYIIENSPLKEYINFLPLDDEESKYSLSYSWIGKYSKLYSQSYDWKFWDYLLEDAINNNLNGSKLENKWFLLANHFPTSQSNWKEQRHELIDETIKEYEKRMENNISISEKIRGWWGNSFLRMFYLDRRRKGDFKKNKEINVPMNKIIEHIKLVCETWITEANFRMQDQIIEWLSHYDDSWAENWNDGKTRLKYLNRVGDKIFNKKLTSEKISKDDLKYFSNEFKRGNNFKEEDILFSKEKNKHVGQIAESIVLKILNQEFGQNKVEKASIINAYSPFDFVVKNEDNQDIYIEVKGTSSIKEADFYISRQEIQALLENKYRIYFVKNIFISETKNVDPYIYYIDDFKFLYSNDFFDNEYGITKNKEFKLLPIKFLGKMPF